MSHQIIPAIVIIIIIKLLTKEIAKIAIILGKTLKFIKNQKISLTCNGLGNN